MIVFEVVIVFPIFKLTPNQKVRTNDHKSIFSSVLFDATSAPVADIFTQSSCLADFSRKSHSISRYRESLLFLCVTSYVTMKSEKILNFRFLAKQ